MKSIFCFKFKKKKKKGENNSKKGLSKNHKTKYVLNGFHRYLDVCEVFVKIVLISAIKEMADILVGELYDVKLVWEL